MRAKVTQLSVVVSPHLKEQIWGEATRLHLTPSRLVRAFLTEGLKLSRAVPAPNQYVITLTEKQALELRKEGFRVEYHPIED